MKKKSIILIIIGLIIIIIGMFLFSNKTFFKTTYIGTNNKEIFIPRYSYFDRECCFTAATFYSLKSEKQLKKEISNYLKEFEYFSDDTTYGFKKDNLFIQSYVVENHGLYRKIIITY